MNNSINFYENKLLTNPTMPKYNHNLAILMELKGNNKKSSELYSNALNSAPNNVMIRNDYALHLAKNKEYNKSINEFNKGLLINEEQPMLHSNITSIYARKGNYDEGKN